MSNVDGKISVNGIGITEIMDTQIVNGQQRI